MIPRCERNGTSATRTESPSRPTDLDDAAIRRTPRRAHHRDTERREHRTHRFEPRRVVVVAGDDDDVGAGVAQVEQRLEDERLGVGIRRRGLVEVAGDEHDVDALGVGDAHDVGQHGRVLGEARLALDRLADVPVGGVQQLHGALGLYEGDVSAARVGVWAAHGPSRARPPTRVPPPRSPD